MAAKLQSKSAPKNESDGMFGTRYGKQSSTDQYEKYSSYKEEIPYLINRYNNSTPKKGKKTDSSKLKKNGNSLSMKDNLKISDSSHTHRDFLQNALKSIESDL